MTDNTERTALGCDANVAAALAYVLGWISGVVLLVTERQNRFVRFHALQSILVFGALSLAWFVCLSIPLLGWRKYAEGARRFPRPNPAGDSSCQPD